MAIKVRVEQPGDYGAVRDMNRAAFDSDGEANLVDALRIQAHPTISLVAEDDGLVPRAHRPLASHAL